MKSKHIPLLHDAHVVVCDGRKALLLRNTGSAAAPRLVVEHTFLAPDNPPSRGHVTDGPGAQQNRFAPTSAVEPPDPHQQAEDAFLAETAGTVNRLSGEGTVTRIVLIAPPRALGVVRTALDEAARACVVAEIAKDLTKHPIAEIERLLVS